MALVAPVRHASLLIASLAPLFLLACPAPGDKAPTWSADIAPLYARQCMACHQEGGIAPFPLTTYAEAKETAEMAAAATAARRMPPWNVDNSGDCQTYRDARWLSDDEIALIDAWVEAGAPEGDAVKDPAKPPTLDTLTGDDVVTVQMAESYTPRPSEEHPSDDYHCFILDPGLTEDRFLTGFEIQPGQPTEVHHMLAYALLSDEAEQAADALDAAEEGPGWTCFGGGGVDGINLLAVWAPGTNVLRYPEGTGVRMKAGHRVVMQIHYNLAAGAEPDRTTLRLQTTPSIEKEAVLAPLSNNDIELPPGQSSVDLSMTVPLLGLGVEAIELHGVFPHMHTLGRTMRYEAKDTFDETEDSTLCLTDVPDWDFNWQQVHFYESPLILTAEQSVRLTCTWDTTSRSEVTRFGEGTGDEMCLVFSYLTLPGGGSIPGLSGN